MNNIVKPTIVLFLVTLFCGMLLGGVNMFTRDAIAQQGVIELNRNLADIYPDCDDFLKLEEELTGVVTDAYEAMSANSSVGFIVETRPMGYGGEIVVLTGINTDGTVEKVKILSMSETPGLGANAQSDDFLGQYQGKTAGIGLSKSSPSGNEILSITSATVTARAITDAVNESLEFFNTNLNKGGK